MQDCPVSDERSMNTRHTSLAFAITKAKSELQYGPLNKFIKAAKTAAKAECSKPDGPAFAQPVGLRAEQVAEGTADGDRILDAAASDQAQSQSPQQAVKAAASNVHKNPNVLASDKAEASAVKPATGATAGATGSLPADILAAAAHAVAASVKAEAQQSLHSHQIQLLEDEEGFYMTEAQT